MRRRQWIVAEVHASTGGDRHTPLQHCLTLSSIGEDSVGEQLEIAWEIEPGAHVIEHAVLLAIADQDDTDELEGFLDAVRLGAAIRVDLGFLRALFRSGLSIEYVQLNPLVRAIDTARANLPTAHDVSLGKTIEAGLVIQEFPVRHCAGTIRVICPTSLQEKRWAEMLEKFGLEFKVVNTDYVTELRRSRGLHVNPWTSFPRLIAPRNNTAYRCRCRYSIWVDRRRHV